MIENTSDRDPLVHLLGMMGGSGQSGYIEEMEAAGAAQMRESTVLPTEGPWEEAEALGFVRGGDTDDLFCEASLPEGWSKDGTGHSMWTNIVDERGIVRAAIFYKAAFYDRRAFWSLRDPGVQAYSDVRWGEGHKDVTKMELPDYWDKLTAEERASALESAEKCLQNDLDFVARTQPDPERIELAKRVRDLIEMGQIGE